MAVVMALFLKYFVVEAYKIPTGSMQPTLFGDERADIKDRILVDKLTYVMRDPDRWDVAVFRYPLDRSKNFVKRIAGVGPEELRIENGDVWCRAPGAEWRIPRRTSAVMRQHWKRLYTPSPEVSPWIPGDLPRGSRWEATGRGLSAKGSGTAAFRGGHEPILDDYLDGYPEALLPWLPVHVGNSAQNAVGDLRLEGRIQALPGTILVVVELREGGRPYRFELPGPAAPEAARARIDAGRAVRTGDDSGPEERHAYRLPAGRRVRFAVENLDDRLVLEIEGEEVLALEIEPARDQNSSIRLALEGEGAEFDELTVFRDVYYTIDSRDPIEIPADCYYMMGDNTQDSSDSREWTFATYSLTGPDGTMEEVRGNYREGENPRNFGFGEPGGPTTLLVDEWGEKRRFRRSEAERLPPRPAPFVPRALIQGKALAVFWPLDPVRGIWRWKWVN